MKAFLLKIVIGILFLSIYSTAIGQNLATPKVKFGKGISYTAPDTSFSVKFQYRMQNLLIVNYNEASEDYSTQFLVRRSRLKLGGFAFTPKLQYKVELGLTNRDISVNKEDGNTKDAARIILDAVLKWNFSPNWTLWVGQTKLAGNRERVISSANLQFVDRSLLNSNFNIDRDAGLQLHGKLKAGDAIIAPSFAITQGEGRNITSTNAGGLSYNAHVDFLPLGKFASKGDYVSADLQREPSPKLAIGFTYNYNDGAVRQGGQLGSYIRDFDGNYAQNSLSTIFVDMMFKYNGFSLLSEYANKTGDDQIDGLSKGYLTGTGFSAQAGYLFKNNVELALRYTNIQRDNGFSGINDENQYTLGISRYIVGHSLKVQSDITRRAFPDTDGIYQFRAQVEMQF